MSVSTYPEFTAALAAGGDTIKLAPSAVITITASTSLRHSNLRITSEDITKPGTLRLEAGADWSGPLLYGSGLTNLTFDNFIIDGNFDSQGGKPRGKGYFNLCNLKDCHNIIIHHMQMRDGGCDGFQFRGCKYITAYENDIEYLGHDAFYFIGSNSEIEVYNNNVLTFTNSAVRLAYGCTNAWIHNNYFHSVFSGGSTGPAIEIDKHGFSGILIENNIIENINGAGIWMTGNALNKGSIIIRNCAFYNTGVYKSYTGYSNAAIVNGNMDSVLVENCTFLGGNVAYSAFDRNGLSVSFTTTFKNCVFSGAVIAALRMPDSGGSAIIKQCNFYGNKAIAIGEYTGKITYSDVTTVDPKLQNYAVGKTSAIYGKGIGFQAVVAPEPDPIENEEPEPEPLPLTIDCDARLREASPDVVYTISPYLDIGKSTASTRSLIFFDVSKQTAPVYKAELQLYWYYPADKSRAADTIIEVYRPGPWADSTATWTKNAKSYYDVDGTLVGSKPFASQTIKASALPTNAYISLDVTELVNEYINGTYANTGFLLKAAIESNNYIAFYGMSMNNTAMVPKLVLTAQAPLVSTKLAINKTARIKESTKTTAYTNNIYLDVGKSTGASRFQVDFDVSKFTAPIESAHLMLAWYYPAGKSRAADTVVTAYRPLTALATDMTWANSAENYDKAKSYGFATIKAAVLPDGKYESIDITDLVNAYITGKYPNTGVFIKALAEGNNYIAFHGDAAIESSVKPYIVIKSTNLI